MKPKIKRFDVKRGLDKLFFVTTQPDNNTHKSWEHEKVQFQYFISATLNFLTASALHKITNIDDFVV